MKNYLKILLLFIVLGVQPAMSQNRTIRLNLQKG